MSAAPPDPTRRLRRYYAYMACVSLYLWGPFWTLWLFRTADYFEATLVDVVFWTTSVLLQIPAGAFADRYGRKPAISIGLVAWTAGIVLWGMATSLWMFWLSSIVWAVGAGFQWNAGGAYLYDTLAESGMDDEYPHVIARSTMISLFAMAAASAMGGGIVATTGAFNPTLLLYVLPGGAALLFALTLPEPKVHRAPTVTMFAQIRAGMRTLRGNAQIVIITAFQVIITVVTYVMMFFRPAFIEAIVKGDFLLMGLGYAAFFCIGAAAGRSMGRVLTRLGESGALVLSYVLVFAPFILVYAVSAGFFDPGTALILGLATQASFYVFTGVEGPVVTTIINRRIPSSERATILAITTFFTTLTLAVFEPMVGVLALRYDLGTGLTAVAAIAAIPCAYLVIAYRRKERGETAAPTAAPFSAGSPVARKR